MSKKIEWKQDLESSSIALRVMQRYDQIFSGIDLSKIRFIRILGKKSQKIVQLKSVGFPFNIDNKYVYYMMINNQKWKLLSEQQKNLAIMNGMYSIADGGTDQSSNGYGMKRKKDVQDFSVILSAAGGRYDWTMPGSQDIPNILSQE